MYEIPLFPLNTVLFPGAPVYLHIFEPRYKEMINTCLETRSPFGVVLIQSGVEAYGDAQPCAVGCSAEIVQVERLDNGRMNLVAVGKNRFNIERTLHEKAYLEGMVEDIDIHPPQSLPNLRRSATELLPWIQQYLKVLQQVHDFKVAWDHFPDDPIELGYLAAHILQLPAEKKQSFLEQNDCNLLLHALCETYRQEIGMIKKMVEHAKANHKNDPDELFSLN